jgi:hypothetical protein
LAGWGALWVSNCLTIPSTIRFSLFGRRALSLRSERVASVSSSQKEAEAFAVLIGLDAAEKDITFNEALDRRGVPQYGDQC